MFFCKKNKMNFTHLHLHTQFSILDGANNISDLFDKVKKFGMNSIAITDHGNMFGVKKFHDTALKKGIKPIIGCEVYLAKNRLIKDKNEKHSHLILLAKNKIGYHNLIKLVSKAQIEGFYKKPRIDKKLLFENKNGLIVSSACIGGQIPRFILDKKFQEAKDEIIEYKKEFSDDFYLEIQRHKTGKIEVDKNVFDKQETVNKYLLKYSKELNVKIIASNDAHFLNKEDAEAHDILLCLSTGADKDDPNRMKYTGEEFVKTPKEMINLFKDIPEAIKNTNEVSEKIENYQLNRDVILPEYPLPENFVEQDDYLKFLTYEGAKKHFPEITEEISKRIDYELRIIKDMGFAGYFLIVQDFLVAARKMDVKVGCGRGSAAGSLVAFCIKITDIDPLKYKLLFERFLNPERVTMPDIDIDFDEEGREKVLNWVVKKYGKKRVAQIITFGTMASRMSIRDVARVLKLDLPIADKLAKLVPDVAKINLKKAFKAVKELNDAKKSADEKTSKTLKFAETLEGSVRHVGVHACGVIIGKDDLINHIPLTRAKDSDLLLTQFDGSYVEDVGMLKMDFLGLKTLSIIKDALENIKLSIGIEIDMNEIPFDDKKTFELYQRGETIGTFQFESEGMRSHLKNLKPTNIEDLIAMNALYRPGPMDYIPSFISRKHGTEKIKYPHKSLEHILKDTYGIMVYQEQIMQTAQIMGGFSLGSADILRRAMGKKKMEIMQEQKIKFIEGAKKKGISEKKSTEVFDIMTEFAKYGFNRSHSAAYSVIAFQTAYLKANYPAEYMSAVLSRNLSDLKKITIFMDECKSMKLAVKGPDINESHLKFMVNKKQDLRFGMAAIKGIGTNVVEDIVRERNENGFFKDRYDFVERINKKSTTKKVIENLVLAGAFESVDGEKVFRSQYFVEIEKNTTYADILIRYGNKFQEDKNKNKNSLFGGGNNSIQIQKPQMQVCEAWTKIDRLNKEKEVIGIYLSSHPLDDFHFEMNYFCNTKINDLQNLENLRGREIKMGGIIASVENKMTKKGKPFGTMVLEDYDNTKKFVFFSKDYENFKEYMNENDIIFLKGVVQKSYRGSELELKINSISMFSHLKTKIKSIALKIPVHKINGNLLTELQSSFKKNKGNTNLSFLIYDEKTKIWVQLFSRNTKLNANNELTKFLKEKNIIYAFNK